MTTNDLGVTPSQEVEYTVYSHFCRYLSEGQSTEIRVTDWSFESLEIRVNDWSESLQFVDGFQCVVSIPRSLTWLQKTKSPVQSHVSTPTGVRDEDGSWVYPGTLRPSRECSGKTRDGRSRLGTQGVKKGTEGRERGIPFT